MTEYKFEEDYSAALVTKEIYPDGNATSDNVQMTYRLDGSLNTKTDQRGVVFRIGSANLLRPGLEQSMAMKPKSDLHESRFGTA